ncbi:DUF6098 family protein [Hamadaea sp. NPDC051192]|uniref:DUF6098 family protein n=1 Tax=Hamadaea sp. NPDC051192 TaxID=3154940 RepID=UPI00342D5759
MPTVHDLDQLAALVEHTQASLFVRWSRGPEHDLGDLGDASRDELTGVPLPGLSANPLAVEPWWVDRSRVLWVARRLYDYSHLRRQRGPGIRAWVLEGTVVGRGPDNEPLVNCERPVAWIADEVLRQALRVVGAQPADQWGPMDRTT